MRKLKNSELDRPDISEFKTLKKFPITIILDNIRSLNNIGSIFRTSDAFKIECIHLCGITAKPPHREIHKTALGATDSVNWQYFNNTIDSVNLLKENDYKLYAIEQIDTSISLEKFQPDFENKLAIVFGNEVKGVSEDILGYMNSYIEIPQFGTKHSLNVAVSAGIIIWDFYIKSLSK